MHDDLILEADEKAAEILSLAKTNADAPVSVMTMVQRITGEPPERARMRGLLGNTVPIRGVYRVFYSALLPIEKRGWVLGHELLHVLHKMRGIVHPHEELLADIVGAMLVAPRPAFREALRTIGARVHVLARAFKTTQSLALLRVGEVSGRSVMVDRSWTRTARGEPFVWPDEYLSMPRRVAHPIRVDGRWGMMAA